jgi:hypothetical protein
MGSLRRARTSPASRKLKPVHTKTKSNQIQHIQHTIMHSLRPALLLLTAGAAHGLSLAPCTGLYCNDECPPPTACAAPPDFCHYDGPVLDPNGCEIGCGNLVCETGCPHFVCDVPFGCVYGTPELDERGCAKDCGPLICEHVMCTDDVKQCPDGSFVSRNFLTGCEFDPCPPLDCTICPYGFFDGCNSCGCGVKPGAPAFCTLIACEADTLAEPRCNDPPVACTQDVKECPDGSFVGRNPDNGCAFDPCPQLDCKTCPFGFFDGCNSCSCSRKTGAVSCTLKACLVMGEAKCNAPTKCGLRQC